MKAAAVPVMTLSLDGTPRMCAVRSTRKGKAGSQQILVVSSSGAALLWKVRPTQMVVQILPGHP